MNLLLLLFSDFSLENFQVLASKQILQQWINIYVIHFANNVLIFFNNIIIISLCTKHIDLYISNFLLSSIRSFFYYLNWRSVTMIIISKCYLKSGFDTTDFWCGIFKDRWKIFKHHKHRNFWKISRVCFYEATIHHCNYFLCNINFHWEK